MYYPVKTSSERWLSTALEFCYKRRSFTIVDDAEWGLAKIKDMVKEFPKFTIRGSEFFFILMFYLIAVISIILLINSFSLSFGKTISIIISFVCLVPCITIPTLKLLKNKGPQAIFREKEIDIRF